MNSSNLKPQQLHPRTVCTSDSVRWPVSCFTYYLTWQAHQLVHSGDDPTSKSIERLNRDPDVKKSTINALPRELLSHPPPSS